MNRPPSDSRRSLLTFLLCASLALSCGGGAPILTSDTAAGSVSGRVFLTGPVTSGTVTAFQLDGQLNRASPLGTTTTDEAGAFTLALPPFNGALLLVASSGTSVDAASGQAVTLDGHALLAAVPDYRSGSKRADLRLTPVSTWAWTLARFHSTRSGLALPATLDEAFTHLNAHLGGVDWRAATPAMPGGQGAVSSPDVRAGLLLAALAARSQRSTEPGGPSAGAAALTTALASDAADGTFDGRGAGSFPGAALTPHTLRLELAQALADVVARDAPDAGPTRADVRPLMAALAAATDPWLFCAGPAAGSGCALGTADVDAPAVTFLHPLEAAGVRGVVPLAVEATDPSGVAALTFLAPASLTGLKARPLPGAPGGLGVEGALDVSALPEGPLELKLRAEDGLGNRAVHTLHLTVANQPPALTVTAPSDGTTVKDTVLIAASASTATGTITRLELLDPPPGVGADTLPEAGAFAASWNTRLAPEGPLTLTLRATNALGAFVDVAVTVTVDNLAPGTVTAAISAGAPLLGATVKLLAIDDATGLPATSRPGGAVLGTSAPTAADGTVGFTLSGENWDGPVQLVASGPNLAFLDPSDGVTQVSVPATFALTSFIPHYKSGDPLVAPITLWTTLADAAARAHAAGKNPGAPGARPLSAALAAVDPLFSGHVSRPVLWTLRTTVPVLLTAPPAQSLRDAVYAALPDLALNQLARTVSTEAHLTPGQVVTAVTLTQALVEDLSDGQFDGRAGGAPLQTPGAPPYLLDANTTRFRLATELDRFIRGPQNFSGLTRADLMNAHVLDNLSGDVCLLYPATQPPLPFDNQPPVVTFTVTFRGADGSTGNAPFGTGRVVAGTLTVTADAADPSGVQSLDVRVNGAPLTVGQGNTQSHFVGTWLTTADGPLTFTALASDQVGNSGPTAFAVTVDNTAPVVAVAAPAVGFFAAQLPVEASATDATGVLTLSPTNLPGFVDLDAARPHVVGTWPIPATAPEGDFTVYFEGCDPVKNCAVVDVGVGIDRTAPTVTLAGGPLPAFTNAASLNVGLVADDGAGAGVKEVKLAVGATVLSGTFAAGQWLFPNVPLPASGSATLVAWAVDRASSSNSGAGKGSPFEWSQTVRVDRTPPAAALSPHPSYFDERTLDFVRLPGGEPQVPVVYTFPLGQQPVTVSPGMTVYKAGTRLKEADGNVPFLHYSVPFDASQDAPVTGTLRWSTAHCPSCLSDVPLLPDPSRVAPGLTFFKLPLTAESLGGRTGALSLTVVFRDGAGNETVRTDALTLTVVRPPVSLVEDAAWAAAADPKSVFAYRVGANSYAALFAGNANFAGHPSARMVRYVVKNPAPYEVAVDLTLIGGVQSIKETWGNQRVDLFARDGNGSFAVDGFLLPRFATWDDNHPAQCTDGTPVPPACSSAQLALSNFPWHAKGSAIQFECGAPSLLSASDVVQAGPQGGVSVHAFASPLPSGNEQTAATAFVDPATGAARGAVVPAAAAGVPGAVVFYVELALPAARPEPLAWQALPEEPVLKYQYHRGDLFLFDSQGFTCAPSVVNARHHAWRWNRFLATATSNVNGLLQVKTGVAEASAGGAKQPTFGMGVFGGVQAFNRSFSH